ncbi:MAG TPA: cellulase family glycosylhydrolase [bacterium]|nr:cellulase family glycosylhydrolase [bacterium]
MNACKKILFVFVLALGCVVWARAGNSSTMGLSVDGERFIDSAGRQVIMRGVCAGSRSKLPPFYPFEPVPDFDTALKAYVDSLAGLGINVVRLLVIYEAAEPVRGEYDEKYLENYDRMVKAFVARGIRVIVDSHQDVYSRRFCGDGFPDWMIGEKYRNRPYRSDCTVWELRYFTPAVSDSFRRLWNNVDGVQDRYVEFFAMLAEKYADEPGVIGFEPINEPVPDFKGMLFYNEWYSESLYKFYEKVADAVNAVDPRYIVFADICSFENPGVIRSDRRRPEIKNLAFAPHYYDLGYLKFLWFNPGGGIESMRKGLGKHAKQAKNWKVPVILTEYGVSMHRDDTEEYITRLYSVFDEMHLSGTVWEASASEVLWNNRDKGIMDPDAAIREKAIALDRPYPRAVAGTVVEFDFERDLKTFDMKWKEEPDIVSDTVVYVPVRIFGKEPAVSIEPGSDYRFDCASGELSIRPLGGAAVRKIEVKASPEK